MKQYQVNIESISPYMQHRMDDVSLEEWERCRRQIIERPEVSIQNAKRAEYHCYRNGAGQCYIPAEQVRGSLINAGTYMKSKVGVRSKSMKTIVAACFLISPDEILISDYDSIDKRSAVNKNIKARVIVIRPKWTTWNASFVLTCQEPTITIQTIRQLFEYAGNYCGIGSFRPTNNGLFGRFAPLNIDELDSFQQTSTSVSQNLAI